MKYFLTLFTFVLAFNLQAQNTVGLLSYDPYETYDGYNLIFPHNQTNVYLLDMCGRLVNVWEDSIYKPGNSVYLMPDGDLYRCGGRGPASNPWIHAGGGGEVIDRWDWNGNLEWRYAINDSTKRMHHDVEILPNGNILAIVWERKLLSEILAAGKDTSGLNDEELWPEMILELEPQANNAANIVWEWHVWDHIIQDFDSTKANYGDPALHPELIDLNYVGSITNADWLHMNAIAYNASLDQIIMSVPTFNEVWIIDHSTTTNQAAGHSGGLAGKGGDLIYRWGNPLTYRQGSLSDEKLGFQHDVHWVDEHLVPGDPDYGKIMIFNNQIGPDYSSVVIINPIFDSYNWEYPMSGSKWGPNNYDWEYTYDPPQGMYSTGLSSAQRLKNGNTLICSGRWGYSFEVTPDDSIVWEYKTPLINGSPVAQGDTSVGFGANLTFRMHRYPENYAAFNGLSMDPIGYIELDPDTTFCPMVSGITQIQGLKDLPEAYPNPASNLVNVSIPDNSAIGGDLRILNLQGKQMSLMTIDATTMSLDASDWPAGVYLLDIEGYKPQKLLIQK